MRFVWKIPEVCIYVYVKMRVTVKLGYKKQLAVDNFHLCHGISSELKTVGKTKTSSYTFSEYF